MIDIAKKEDGNMPVAQSLGQGFEDLDFCEDLIIPRIKLCQGLTSEVTEGIATIGDFLNSLSKKNYGKLIAFVPIKFMKSYIEWGNKSKGEPNIKNISYDGKFWIDGTPVKKDDPRLKFGDDGSKPSVTKYMQFPSIIVGDENQALPSFISFGSSSIKEGKILLNIALMKGGNIYDNIYTMRSEKQENEKGIFQVPKLEINGMRTSTSELKIKAEKFLKLLETTSVTFHIDGE